MNQRERLGVVLVLEIEVGADAPHGRMGVSLAELGPLLTSLIELESLQQRNDLVDFHELSLFESKVGIGPQLLTQTLAELLPVEVTNQDLKQLLVQLVCLRQCVHVDLDKRLILQRLRQGELGPGPVLDLAETTDQQTVKHVILLDFESGGV